MHRLHAIVQYLARFLQPIDYIRERAYDIDSLTHGLPYVARNFQVVIVHIGFIIK